MIRVYRNFYRFELYCNLFRIEYDDMMQKPNQDRIRQQQVWFLTKFPPWEFEQFTCVYHYCYLRLSPAYNEIAFHDVEWYFLAEGMFPDLVRPNGHKEGVLAAGLQHLRDIVTTQTYQNRKCLLAPTFTAHNNRNFFYSTIVHPIFLNNARNDELAQRNSRPEEIGPYSAWQWAKRNGGVNSSSIIYNKADLLNWAYCMWDLSRLRNWGVLRKPRNLWRAHRIYDWLVESEKVVAQKWQESWQERLDIYELGGRGRWDEGDKSGIIWPARV
ncbi:MAG: hypothetical protein M1827_006187 [Pycnora praestabilis]|nr:MAG: hypothetical protein M1827_006187 [Pycnora praestabilis]